jgi:hypothetical protein
MENIIAKKHKGTNNNENKGKNMLRNVQKLQNLKRMMKLC